MATETLENGVEHPAKEETRVGDAEKEDESKDESEEEKEEEGSKKSLETLSSSNRPMRERKKVELYSLSTPLQPTPTKSLSIEKGRGTLLKEIPNVAYQLSKRKADSDLILLHTVLYGKKAKAQMVKKNIGLFSGFVWSENEEEKLRARVKEKLDKCVKDKLIFFCDVLDIPISKSNIKKEEVAVKVLEFLESPKALRDVLLADREKQAKKRKSTQRKRKSAESSDTPAKRKRQTKKREHPSDTEEGKGEGDSDSEGTKDTHDQDDAAPEEDSDHVKTETEDEKDEAEYEKPSDKKISSKKTKEESSSGTKDKDKQASANGSKKSSENSSKRVDKSTSSPAKKQKVDNEKSSKGKSKKQSVKTQANGSKEKGKATKKGKVEPTREAMLEFVSKILKEVDFNTATLSTILQKLSDHFGVDLSHRKPEVKEVIQDAINEMTDDEEEDEEEKSEAGSDKENEEEEKAEAESNKGIEEEEEEEKLKDKA
ncbi:unnamed protein product [Eruca vesicaria subsp. sativa]|uniref:DEK-C domain-containing protein n=1 Tax=Eruca vesicaria subsp. sativa TaxID=29727 RepID=A0ABC8JXX6_ERUVS|nr:unnamed protein product [Eruca vesicaria subsp. sativa]